MDADVMITIAFCLEVFLFALAAALFAAQEVRKSRSQTTAEIRTEPTAVASAKPIGIDRTRAGTASAGRVVRGLRP
jgi:hypothetical protein